MGPEGDQIEIGWWISEGGNCSMSVVGLCLTVPHPAAHPYWLLHEKFNIDFASPKGPNPHLDPGSVTVRSPEMTSLRTFQ